MASKRKADGGAGASVAQNAPKRARTGINAFSSTDDISCTNLEDDGDWSFDVDDEFDDDLEDQLLDQERADQKLAPKDEEITLDEVFGESSASSRALWKRPD